MPSEYVKAAKAVLKAQGEREASWNGKSYDLTDTECYKRAYEEAGLSDEIIGLLDFGSLWWNDIHDWAESVLKGEK